MKISWPSSESSTAQRLSHYSNWYVRLRRTFLQNWPTTWAPSRYRDCGSFSLSTHWPSKLPIFVVVWVWYDRCLIEQFSDWIIIVLLLCIVGSCAYRVFTGCNHSLRRWHWTLFLTCASSLRCWSLCCTLTTALGSRWQWDLVWCCWARSCTHSRHLGLVRSPRRLRPRTALWSRPRRRPKSRRIYRHVYSDARAFSFPSSLS